MPALQHQSGTGHRHVIPPESWAGISVAAKLLHLPPQRIILAATLVAAWRCTGADLQIHRNSERQDWHAEAGGSLATVLSDLAQKLGPTRQSCRFETTSFGEQELKLVPAPSSGNDGTLAIEGVAPGLIHATFALCAQLEQGLQQPVEAVSLVDSSCETLLLGEWNDTFRPYQTEQTVQQLFEAQVEASPERIAVMNSQGSYSYAQLENWANGIAQELRKRAVGPGSFVAIAIPRRIELLAAILGTLKAGAAYVPIEPSLPGPRRKYILENSGARHLLVSNEDLSEGFEQSGVELIPVACQRDAPSEPRPQLQQSLVSSSAYVIYTSGTTGTPKGVHVKHKALLNLIQWMAQDFGIREHDRSFAVASAGFDLSVFDFLGMLALGGSIYLASEDQLSEPEHLAAALGESGATIWNSAPTALSQLLPMLEQRKRPGRLRLALLSGDWIPLSMPQQMQRIFPGLMFVGLGGATEATVWSNSFIVDKVDPEWTSIPYGRPMPNSRYYVLGPGLELVPPGVPGDLFIAGDCLAEGYLNRPKLTEASFFSWTRPDGLVERLYRTGDRAQLFEDGLIEFLGRIDEQVKIRGYRVELSELSTALQRIDGVKDAVALARVSESEPEGEARQKSLAAYALMEHPRSEMEILQELTQQLPPYMIPESLFLLEEWPKTPNGKLDRAALASMRLAAKGPKAGAEAMNDLEAEVLQVWQKVLKRPDMGLDDNFILMGGNSLSALQLRNRIRDEVGLDFRLNDLIAEPTPRALLAGIVQRATAAGNRLVPLQHRKEANALICFPGSGGHVFTFMEMARGIHPAFDVLGVPLLEEQLHSMGSPSIETLATAYHDFLAKALTEYHSIVLLGYSAGSYLAFQLQGELRRTGVNIAGTIVLDMCAPGYPRKPHVSRRMATHLWNMISGREGARLNYLAARFRKRMGLAPQLRSEAELIERAELDADAELNATIAAYHQALRCYWPEPKPGLVHVIRAETPPHYPTAKFDDPFMGWGPFVLGGLSQSEAPGAHLSLFYPENLPTLITRVNEALEQFDII